MSEPKSVRPPVLAQLRERLIGFVEREKSLLGHASWRTFKLLGYAIGSLFATYSILHFFFKLNITILDFKRLPFWDFYRLDLIPFLAHPVTWVGIEPHSMYEALMVMSGIGGSLWANAEFRRDWYIPFHVFPGLQKIFRHDQHRPGEVDLKRWDEPPVFDSPPPFFSKRSLARFPHAALLGYSLLGLAGMALGVIGALRITASFLWELLLFSTTAILFIAESLLYPFERMDDQQYLGTRVFLVVYDFRRKLDEMLDKRFEPEPFPVGQGFKRVLRDIATEAGRVVCLTAVLLALFALFYRNGNGGL